MKSGIELIAEERKRQIEVEGWTDLHDDNHEMDELALAAASYALPSYARPSNQFHTARMEPQTWPWSGEYWKPSISDRVRELQKAGALIAAEIDRLNRLND